MVTKLKPCPFCYEDKALSIDRTDDVFRYVECGYCGAHGPVEGTEDEDEEFGTNYAAAAERDAILGWNAARRPRPQPKRKENPP